MRKERVEAAQHVAEKLFAAEATIDSALAAAAELSAAMPAARTHAGLSAILGQDALESATAALTCLVEARQKIVAAHGALDQVKTDMGLRTHAFGGGMLKPIGNTALHIVENKAA